MSDSSEEAIKWWNGMHERERRYWLEVANSPRPIDAWYAYQRAKARDEVAAEDLLRAVRRGRS